MPDLSTSQQSLNKVVKECGSCKDEVFLFFFSKYFDALRFRISYFAFALMAATDALVKSNATFGPGLCSIQGLCLQFRNRNHNGQWQSWFGRGMGGAQNVAKVWNTDNPDILWLLSISVLFVVFAFIPQVEMEHAESWEDYELQLACWSMFSKPLFKFLLRFKIQHMCSIPLPHSCAAYLSMKTYENQGRCSPCLRLLWSELRDGFTTSDPHIDSHHFECLFHCAAAFCTSKSCHKLGWLKHGWFSWDTLDMKWWLPGWISRYQRWIGIQKAAASIFFCCCWILLKLVFFFSPRQQGDVGVTMDPGQ